MRVFPILCLAAILSGVPQSFIRKARPGIPSHIPQAVTIEAEEKDGYSLCSGSVIRDGIVLTARHCVAEDDHPVVLYEAGDAVICDVSERGIKPGTAGDWALLSCDTTGISPLGIAKTSAPAIGLFYSAPHGKQWAYPFLIADRMFGQFLLLAMLDHGDSGGALVNSAFQVIGVVSAMSIANPLIGFATPTDDIITALAGP